MNKKWQTLRWATIVGIIDSYGAVHSKMFPFETPVSDLFHESVFGAKGHCAWRWTFDQSVSWITAEMQPDEEQFVAIQNHLTKKYNLKWWENGHFDIDHFLENLKKETK